MRQYTQKLPHDDHFSSDFKTLKLVAQRRRGAEKILKRDSDPFVFSFFGVSNPVAWCPIEMHATGFFHIFLMVPMAVQSDGIVMQRDTEEIALIFWYKRL